MKRKTARTFLSSGTGMKRLATLLLALLMLCSLFACGYDTTPANDEANQSQGETNVEAEAPDIEAAAPDIEVEEPDIDAGGDVVEISFTEVVAIDNEECSIKITAIDHDNFWGYTLKALLENKSEDKTYMFSVSDASVNGVQSDPFFAAEVTAGKKANEEISFSTDELEKNGVGEFTDIELTFRIYDSEDWFADDVAKETIHIYPYGEDKAVKFVREAQASDNVIIDNEYVTVIVTGYENDDIWGYSVQLFLLNKTDKNIMFSIDNASVNGFMADPFYACSVSAGNCAFSSASWSDTTLEENGITEIEELEFVFRAYDDDDWFADDFANETITLNP